MIIYKITNQINQKVYIGLTTCSLEYRWSRHLICGRDINNNKPLYRAMRKHGVNNFTIEQIDQAEDLKQLGILERKYIKEFNSRNINKGYNLTAGGESNQYDGNPASKVTVDDVIQIREIYAMGELRCKECWQLFKHKLSYSGFQKIWEGITWQGIMSEIYTEENIKKHSKQKANPGSQNGNALYTEKEVLEARKYYVNHTLQETFEKFGKTVKSSFRGILDKTYKNIPIYSKIKKQWFLYGEPIDINDYNPVSTISESGE